MGNSNRQIDESQAWNPLKRPRPCLAGPAPGCAPLPLSVLARASTGDGPGGPDAKTLALKMMQAE